MHRLERAGIGLLEAEVLGLVKSLESASTADVLDKLKGRREIAYTTISTTLDRLYKKGLLGRQVAVGKGGQRYIYEYRNNPKLERELVTRVVDRLVNAFGSSAISAIYQRLDEVSQDATEELRRAIEKRRLSK